MVNGNAKSFLCVRNMKSLETLNHINHISLRFIIHMYSSTIITLVSDSLHFQCYV